MTQLTTATWAAINLVAGLIFTFLAPTQSAVIAEPVAVTYLLVFGSVQLFLQLRSRKITHGRLILLSVISLVTGGLIAFFPFENPANCYHEVISHWAITQALLLTLVARKVKFKTPMGRDLLVTAVASLVLGILLYQPGFALRDILGFFSAYLLVTAVLFGIAAASEAK